LREHSPFVVSLRVAGGWSDVISDFWRETIEQADETRKRRTWKERGTQDSDDCQR